VDIKIAEVAIRVEHQDIHLQLTPEARDLLATKGYDPQYGARPLRRTIQQLVEDPLCEALLSGEFKPGDAVTIGRTADGIELKVRDRAVTENSLQTLPSCAE